MSLPKLKEGSQIKDYVIIKELGAGCFGRVYEALHTKKNNMPIAIKCVSKQLKQTSAKAYQLFQAERTILAKIQNDNVVGFVDYFESNSVCFLCLEFCNEGDVEQYLATKDKKRVPEEEAIEFYKQILNGFKALHENNILHRDMKLPNILKHNGQLKIADLGFAKELKSERQLTATILGTPYTMAPEVLEEKPYGLSCDIYSIGVNFYQILFGKYPFNGRSEYELLQNIKKQNIQFDVPGVVISEQMKDFLRRMLQCDINKRITMAEIWQHPIIKQDENHAGNIGLGQLGQSKINFAQNKDFYANQNPFQQGNNQQNNNPFAPPVDQSPKNIEIVPENDSKIPDQDIFNTYKVNKEAEQAIKQVIQLYLNEINTINQIKKCVHSSHVLPETQINTFYPCFFMLKKLIHQQTRVLKDLESKKNVFNCQYPEQLFKHPLYERMVSDLREKIEMNSMYFMARKFDMEDLMNQTPDPQIIEQLQNDNYTEVSEKFFKQTMMNYYINLQEEMNKHIRLNNVGNAIKFQKHIVETLDCLDLDTFFRVQPNFKFEAYQEFNDGLDFKARQQIIEQKGRVVFSVFPKNK